MSEHVRTLAPESGSPGDRFHVSWYLDDDRVDRVVVDVTEAKLSAVDDAHCPACQADEVVVARVPSGGVFLSCTGCERIWGVHGDRFTLVVDAVARRR